MFVPACHSPEFACSALNRWEASVNARWGRRISKCSRRSLSLFRLRQHEVSFVGVENTLHPAVVAEPTRRVFEAGFPLSKLSHQLTRLVRIRFGEIVLFADIGRKVVQLRRQVRCTHQFPVAGSNRCATMRDSPVEVLMGMLIAAPAAR